MSQSPASTEVIEFLLPDVGEGVVEGEVVRWLVQEGDQVREDQAIAEVMTDKATVEISSPYNAVVDKLCWKEGEIAKVHAPLVLFRVSGTERPAHAKPAEEKACDVGSQMLASIPEAPAKPHGERVLATPATRRLARELGLDLRRVPASGKAGRVLKEDLYAFMEGTSAKPKSQPVSVGGDRIPVRGLRKLIADKMSQSLHEAAHVTHVDEVDLTELVALRARLKDEAAQAGVKLTYLPFFVKATVQALKKFPMFNASWVGDQIAVHGDYHIGIATATETGLMVPVIKHADRLSLLEIAQRINELSEKARTGKASRDELTGSTFTLTNIGAIGGLFATPIINLPEVAILAVNKLQKRPVVMPDGQIVARDMMYLALSFDHRVTDGAEAARFVNEIARLLAEPGRMMLEMA